MAKTVCRILNRFDAVYDYDTPSKMRQLALKSELKRTVTTRLHTCLKTETKYVNSKTCKQGVPCVDSLYN